MMIRPHIFQLTRDQVPGIILGVPRVNYEQLLDSLTYPVVWSYDIYLDGWFPAEVSKIEGFTDEELRAANLVDPEGRVPIEQLQENCKRDGYVQIPALFHPEYTRGTLSNSFWRRGEDHKRWPEMMGIKRLSINNLPVMRLIHQSVEAFTNSLTPEPVKTSYSFASAYEKGSALPEHTDRPQCIYNISLLLSGSPSNIPLTSWPLYIKHAETTNRVELREGDAVLYSGTRDPHWRDTMPSSLHCVLGVFFHFVRESWTGSLD